MVPNLEPIQIKPTENIDTLTSELYVKMTTLVTKPLSSKVVDVMHIKKSLAELCELGWLYKFVDASTGLTHGYLGFTIDMPWYSDKPCLSELFVLQTHGHGFGRMAVRFLKEQAKKYGCGLMETGATMTDEPEELKNLYEKKGKCDFTYPSFVWFLPYWNT